MKFPETASSPSSAWLVYAFVVLFIVFGASAVGWNGIFLAEIARRSPHGAVGVATGGAMVWSFGGILIGPALFASVYKLTGDYAQTFGWLAIVAAVGLIFIYAARRDSAQRASTD